MLIGPERRREPWEVLKVVVVVVVRGMVASSLVMIIIVIIIIIIILPLRPSRHASLLSKPGYTHILACHWYPPRGLSVRQTSLDAMMMTSMKGEFLCRNAGLLYSLARVTGSLAPARSLPRFGTPRSMEGGERGGCHTCLAGRWLYKQQFPGS